MWASGQIGSGQALTSDLNARDEFPAKVDKGRFLGEFFPLAGKNATPEG